MKHIKPYPIFELYREPKKAKSKYFTKKINITKIDLEHICKNLGLKFSDIKFLSSGQFGNAYRVGDKVLKISLDKSEAKSVYDITKTKQKRGIIHYHSVSMYKLHGQFVYVIVMDYVTPLTKWIKTVQTIDLIDFCFDITEIICNNWGKLDTREDFIEKVSELFNMSTARPISKLFVKKVWNLYQKIKNYTTKTADLHPYNIGIRKDGQFVLYDFSEIGSVRKFNNAEIMQ